MCCLFGLIDYRHSLTTKETNRILSILATACEVRGTDATGIAYNSGGKLRVYKRPWPAHFMRFHVPGDANVIMGHTRMTTQGSASRNYNNHPFLGNAGRQPFTLAHNGVLYNDDLLRRALSLPNTKIQTDSFVSVQLLEKQKHLGFDSLRYMAEQLRGSFTLTVLDNTDTLYFLRGNNPMCIYHFPASGLYLYASTEEILKTALQCTKLRAGAAVPINLCCGEILKINSNGRIDRSHFENPSLYDDWVLSMRSPYSYSDYGRPGARQAEQTYLDEVKSVAASFGYTPEDIDRLTAHGFSPEELEEFLYCGEL